MLPSSHIFLGAITSFFIFIIFPQIGWLAFLIIFLSSVLIDFDHYLYYVVKKKDFSLMNAYAWFIKNRDIWMALSKKEKEKFQQGIIIFHGIECWILLILLTLISRWFLFVLIGVLVHMVFDFIELYKNNSPFYIKFSQVYTHRKNKRLKLENEGVRVKKRVKPA